MAGITYLKHDEINKTLWDECIAKSVKPMIYAQSWYLDIVAPGWEALVQGNYYAVMPLPRRQKVGIHYIFSPNFVQQLGIFSPVEANVEDFIEEIPEHYRYVDVNFNEANFIPQHYYPDINANVLLSINNDYEVLEKLFADNVKRNLKKAHAAGFEATALNGPDEIIELFKENRGKSVGYTDADYDLLKEICKAAQQRNLVEYLGILDEEGNVCGGAVFLKSYNRYIFIFSGNNGRARDRGAMHMLIASFIQKHAGEDVYLDFEGSNNTSLARFYKSFGGFKTTYQKLVINRLPLLLRWLK